MGRPRYSKSLCVVHFATRGLHTPWELANVCYVKSVQCASRQDSNLLQHLIKMKMSYCGKNIVSQKCKVLLLNIVLNVNYRPKLN